MQKMLSPAKDKMILCHQEMVRLAESTLDKLTKKK